MSNISSTSPSPISSYANPKEALNALAKGELQNGNITINGINYEISMASSQRKGFHIGERIKNFLTGKDFKKYKTDVTFKPLNARHSEEIDSFTFKLKHQKGEKLANLLNHENSKGLKKLEEIENKFNEFDGKVKKAEEDSEKEFSTLADSLDDIFNASAPPAIDSNEEEKELDTFSSIYTGPRH
jgi:hypothetical protein